MNISVKLRHYPDLMQVEQSVVDVLAQPSMYHRLGPAMQRNNKIPTGSGYAVLNNFGPYTNASNDQNRKTALDLEVYIEVIGMNEDLFLQNLVEKSPRQSTLEDFVRRAAEDGTSFVYLGSSLWRQFCIEPECQRMVHSKKQIPWLMQMIGGTTVLPAIQAGAGFLPPILGDTQALIVNHKIYYNYDYQAVIEMRSPGRDDEYLVDYMVGFEWSGSQGELYLL